MSKALLLSSCLIIILAFTAVWLFEPAIHYYESVNVNTMGSNDFSMTDRFVIHGGTVLDALKIDG